MVEIHHQTPEGDALCAELVRSGDEVSIAITCAADPMLGTVFGEWLGAVRGVLDHVFYQLAIHETRQNPPTRKGDRQFPVCKTVEEFDALLVGRHRPMHGFSDAAVAAVRAMQPMNGKYGADGDAILWLHDLARQDRHRVPWRMGGLIIDVRWEIRESDLPGIVAHRKADLDEVAPVADADLAFVPVTFKCESEDAARSLADGGIGVDVESRLELVDWFVHAHTSGISANIRNDVLGDRMAFVEYFLGLVIDSFESMCA